MTFRRDGCVEHRCSKAKALKIERSFDGTAFDCTKGTQDCRWLRVAERLSAMRGFWRPDWKASLWG